METEATKPTELDLLVPLEPYNAIYKRGTAFVGQERGEDFYLIHFEEPGDYCNVVTFEDRITHAAGRLADHYPTSKMLGGDRERWKKVGSVAYLEGVGWYISDISDAEMLSSWDDGPHVVGGGPDFHEKIRVKEFNEAMKKGEWWKIWKQ